MPLITKRKQVCAYGKASIGAFGATTNSESKATVITANNVLSDVYEPVIAYDLTNAERNPARAQISSLGPVPASRFATVTFGVELKGSGTSGVAPLWATRLFPACGLVGVASTGSAAIGTVNPDVSTGALAVPTVAGTFAGTKSGKAFIQITALVADTSIGFSVVFIPADGTAASVYTGLSQTSATAITLSGGALDGVTVDFGDPDASTAGFALGHRYVVNLTSSAQTDVVFKPTDSPASFAYVDLGVIEDGRLHKIKNAMGTFTITANREGFGRIDFTFTGSIAEDVDPFEDQALIASIPYIDETPDPFVGVTAVVDSGTPACFSEFTFDAGNAVAMLPCATDPSGYKSAYVTYRSPVGTIDPQAVVFATKDWHGKALAGNQFGFSLNWGAAGTGITFTARNAQLTALPDTADSDGILRDTLNVMFAAPNFDGGADYSPYSITIK
jgi:hypothetical protein